MSKLYCASCKYYDYNTREGVDWCRLNDEETGICGHCEREFEDLDEATEHYDAVVEENNKLYSLNCEMAGKVAELEHRLANCIEPKFIYGQYVWCVYPENEHRKGFVFKMDFVGYTKDKIICCINENEEFDYDMVFATEAEAKKKLNEVKNGSICD